MESNNQRQFNAAVVVEGRDNTRGLEQFSPGIETIETSGSEVSDQTLVEVGKLAKAREVITFIDPDYNSKRIKRLVISAAPNTKQAFVAHKEGEPAERGNSSGVERVSKEALARALGGSHEVQTVESDIIKEKYDGLGLTVSPEARLLCEGVGVELGIGYENSKQFLKRSKMFGTTYRELKRATEDVK